MKSAALAASTLCLLAGACGDGDRTNCAIARERLDRYLTEAEVVAAAVRNQGVPSTIDGDCSDMNACAAACVKDASCEAIRLIILGSTTDPNLVKPPDFATFNLCLYACIETYRQPQRSAAQADPLAATIVHRLFRSHHSRAESRTLSVGSGASGSVPKGNRTVVNIEEFPAIPLAVVA